MVISPPSPPPRSPLSSLQVLWHWQLLLVVELLLLLLPFGNNLPDPTILCNHVHTAHWNVQFTMYMYKLMHWKKQCTCENAICNLNLLSKFAIYNVPFTLQCAPCVTNQHFTQYALQVVPFNVQCANLQTPIHIHCTCSLCAHNFAPHIQPGLLIWVNLWRTMQGGTVGEPWSINWWQSNPSSFSSTFSQLFQKFLQTSCNLMFASLFSSRCSSHQSTWPLGMALSLKINLFKSAALQKSSTVSSILYLFMFFVHNTKVWV